MVVCLIKRAANLAKCAQMSTVKAKASFRALLLRGLLVLSSDSLVRLGDQRGNEQTVAHFALGGRAGFCRAGPHPARPGQWRGRRQTDRRPPELQGGAGC